MELSPFVVEVDMLVVLLKGLELQTGLVVVVVRMRGDMWVAMLWARCTALATRPAFIDMSTLYVDCTVL